MPYDSFLSHVDEDLQGTWLDLLAAAIVIIVLIILSVFLKGRIKIFPISALLGFIAFFLDFYLKDLVETVE